MKKNTVFIIYIAIGWLVGACLGLYLAINPRFLANLSRCPYPKAVKQVPEGISCPRDYDKLAASYIAAGREKEAINALLDIIKRNTIFDDDLIIKRSPFSPYVDPVRSCRYLSTIDSISILIRIGQWLKIPEEQMKSLITPYAGDFNNPESVQEFVTTLEYSLSFYHLENAGDLLNKFKKYLHTHYSDERIIKKQYGYLFYYPYLMGRFLSLKGDYEKSIQYLKLAMEFRPDYNGVVSIDLVEAYLKMHRNGDARSLIKSVLSYPRNTSEFMFFRRLYHE
jgi:tetratricopeptide (TPR) repeat protein